MSVIKSASLIFLILSTAIFLVGFTHYSNTVDLSEDLVLHYEFTGSYEDGDRIEDLSPAASNATFVGEKPNQTNRSPGSLSFSEESGYIHVQLDNELSGDFTLTTTVQNKYHKYYAGIIAGKSWQLVAPYGKYEFSAGDTTLQYDVDNHGAWHHLAVVHRDGTTRLYVDGELVESKSGGSIPTEDTLFIGQRPGGYPYQGQIGEITLHERALTTEEIRGMYTDQQTIRPIIYSDAFRTGTVLVLLSLVVFLAQLESRIRSP
ncbi:LamG domain-containing protein [Natrinema salinisoli]|uniref:LamG domain-containing protein n=1 Tax=Natrinema salinisoli TaxID=2878535 RepID=UPI001CEFFB71|nr:LamG domain-containing protein [Natrinema salinisoli]